MSKIALIANGITKDDPEALETILRSNHQDVDIFDVRTMEPTATGWAIREGDILKPIDPSGYGLVARIIQGGKAGDSEKSWQLQQLFENHGAKPYISVKAARGITDKILCRDVLNKNEVPTFSARTFAKDGEEDFATMAAKLEAFAPPYVVRKSLGSGKDSRVVVATVPEAIAAAEAFRHPPEPNGIASGVVIHPLPARLNQEIADRYQLGEIGELDKRSYQFRVTSVDGNIFGANLVYSQPNGFGLNAAQGAQFHSVPLEMMPPEVLVLARKAAKAHQLNIAAVDIAFDNQSDPQVLDMNASPDLNFANEQGKLLKSALADSLRAKAMEGPFSSASSVRTTPIAR